MRSSITCILFIFILSSGFAQTVFTIDGLIYKAISDSTAGLYSRSQLTSDSINIPPEVTYSGRNYKVATIHSQVFAFYSVLKSVTIPNTVTRIENDAFEYCTNLTSVIIPDSVNYIGSGAFYCCSKLSSISFPKLLKSVGNSAFSGTAWLNMQPDGVVYISNILYEYKGNKPAELKVIIKDGITHIADYAFSCSGNDDYSLISITIPSSVKSIGNYASKNCKGLTSVTIPSSVDFIGDYAFRDCTSLTSATTPFSWCGKNIFYGCTNLTSIILPNDLTSIKSYAFRELRTMTSITIPSSITTIEDHAFDNCTSLTTIDIPNSVTSIENYAFNNCKALTTINIPNSVIAIGNNVFTGTAWYNNQPDGIIYAGMVAYSYKGTMPNETNIILRDSTLGIAGYAFATLSELKSIVIPSTVVYIGQAALSSINIKSIYANPLVPPRVGYLTFGSVNKSTCTLYVPFGSKGLYQTALYWKDFSHVYEKQNTETHKIYNNEIVLSYNSLTGTLHLKGFDGPASLLTIFNLHGNIVFSDNITDDKPVYVGYLTTGAYIIQIANRGEKNTTRKIIVL
jgi:hypothetical protein